MSHTPQKRHLETVAKHFHGPGAFAIRKPKVAILVGIIICVWGILSTLMIPKESAPYIEYGIVNISTGYQGASAIDVDTLVTQEIEDKIKSVSGINKYSSTSSNGLSQITVEFDPGVDMTKAVSDIRSKVDQAKPFLPSEVDDDPNILEIDSSLQPFLSVVLSGPYSGVELRDYAEDLRVILEDVPNVARVDISGGTEREIAVMVDQEKLESLSMPLSEVTNTIRASHRDTPLGDFEIEKTDYSLRFSGKHTSAEDIKSVILRDANPNNGHSLIRVQDIAKVVERGEENNSVQRFVEIKKEMPLEESMRERIKSFFHHIWVGMIEQHWGVIILLSIFLGLFINAIYPLVTVQEKKVFRITSLILSLLFLLFWMMGYSSPPQYTKTGESIENSIQISVSRKSETDIFAADAGVKEAVSEFQEKKLPENMNINFIQVMTDIIREDYKEVVLSGLQSIIMVMIFIFLFVGILEGLIASLVIPTAFLMTIGLLNTIGTTLNFTTNFSMILALGILVDTAIVIVEGAHHFLKKGFTPTESAILSLHEYRSPLLSGTITTLAVFIPLFVLPGIMGQFLSFIPITVSLVLVCSLFISLILLPSYAAQLLPERAKEEMKNPRKSCIRTCFGSFRKKIDGKTKKIIDAYGNTLKRIIEKRKYRLGLFGVVLILFILSFRIPIPFELFPSGDGVSISVKGELPTGSQAENTLESILPIEKELLSYPEVQYLQTSVSGENATVYAELLPMADREALGMRTSLELQNNLTKRFAFLEEETNGATLQVQRQQGGPPSEFPVGFRVIAKDSDNIEDARIFAEQLTDILKTIPGTSGVKNDIEDLPGEFEFRVDREKAILLGLNPENIPGIIRTAINGSTAATISRDGRDIDVIVEYDEASLNSIQDIQNIKILNQNGDKILLNQVASMERNNALASLRRRDGDISFTISSLLGEGGNAGEITEKFWAKYEEMGIISPSGVEIIEAGENEENADLFAALGSGLVISILIMFLILVIQFNRFLQPILILFTILFAQIGVAVGLYISGAPRSLAYILGVIALAGIVVNDAIIMVDQMNRNTQARKEKNLKTYLDQIVESGKSRFIPVVLTTLTTSAGIIPLIFIDTFWAGLSFTIIFGLIVASFLTLFVTPALYIQFEKEKWRTFGLIIAVIIGTQLVLWFWDAL